MNKKIINDILLEPKEDRRILSNVPDKREIRKKLDRRGERVLEDYEDSPKLFIESKKSGIRYIMESNVDVNLKISGKKKQVEAKSLDISTTGILIKLKNKEDLKFIKESKEIILKFEIEKGSMPEGYEMKVKIKANIIRGFEEESQYYIALSFEKPLYEYSRNKKDKYIIAISSLALLFVTIFIILMRIESIIYFEFNKFVSLYSIIAAFFLLSRYLFGVFYRPIELDLEFTPGVTIIIPCFNEEEWIDRTVISCINQDYPLDKLEVIVVDDCSTDKSVYAIKKTIEKLKTNAYQYEIEDRLSAIFLNKNVGKREALCEGVKKAKHDLVVFVDSDSFLDPFAIRNLVQPFKDPKMGGVSGRTDVANTYTNVLTKMQSVRYYIAFRIMKAAEAYFDAVTCLSGPLACYKKSIIIENMDKWLNQKFLGQKATFGDDRAMTNIILRNYRTFYQDTAICSTIVPNKYNMFLKQQMRWKRSWLRESIIASSFMWRKEPFMAILFYMGVIVPIAAPIIVIYNLIYMPLVNGIFPTTFLIGILMMSLMMSFTQLLLRKSTTWIFGFVFCIYYEAILLWQMPIAWGTFWKSNWGTRMTPSDIEEANKKKNKRKMEQRFNYE